MQKTVYNDSSRTAQTTIKADRSPSTVVITCAQALVCLFVCFLAGLRKNFSTDFQEIRWKCGTWATEEIVRF